MTFAVIALGGVALTALAAWWRAHARATALERRAAMTDTERAQLTETNRRLESLVAEHERTRAALAANEEQLRQAQKMEAVGRLAGGVAHDFNNILTAITAYAEFLVEALPPNDPRSDDAREIRRAARRAATLTSQLLAFSRRQVYQPRPLDVNAVVNDLSKILGRVIGEDVKLAIEPAESLGTVNADPSQVEQVLMNLVVNASDAMPDGGTVTVSTASERVSGAVPNAQPPLRAGDYVTLRVSDTGTGIDAATMAHIFDPFFTTKGPGKGTGLGLATVYAIAERNGGAVAVTSVVGKGTEFTVYIPRIDQAAQPYASGTFSPNVPGGTETLLLVEDDEAVRALATRILERRGYTVITARDGRDGLERARQHREDIHLLITDVVMPEVGGRRLSQSLASQRPGMKVLYLSGYTGGEIDRRGELDSSIAFLQKPFTAMGLLGKVREVLDGGI